MQHVTTFPFIIYPDDGKLKVSLRSEAYLVGEFVLFLVPKWQRMTDDIAEVILDKQDGVRELVLHAFLHRVFGSVRLVTATPETTDIKHFT